MENFLGKRKCNKCIGYFMSEEKWSPQVGHFKILFIHFFGKVKWHFLSGWEETWRHVFSTFSGVSQFLHSCLRGRAWRTLGWAPRWGGGVPPKGKGPLQSPQREGMPTAAGITIWVCVLPEGTGLSVGCHCVFWLWQVLQSVLLRILWVF